MKISQQIFDVDVEIDIETGKVTIGELTPPQVAATVPLEEFPWGGDYLGPIREDGQAVSLIRDTTSMDIKVFVNGDKGGIYESRWLPVHGWNIKARELLRSATELTLREARNDTYKLQVLRRLLKALEAVL
jgi:hypothetical protein